MYTIVHITRYASTKSAGELMSGRRFNRAYSGRHATKKDNTTPRVGMFPAPWAGRLSTRLCPDASTSEASDDVQGALGHVANMDSMITAHRRGCRWAVRIRLDEG